MKIPSTFKTGFCFGLFADLSFFAYGIVVKMVDGVTTPTRTLSPNAWWTFLLFLLFEPIIFGLLGIWFIDHGKLNK